MAHLSKTWSHAAAALLLAATSGCSPGEGAEGPARALSAADAGSAAALAPDELLTITLDARLSTGFAWQVDELDASVLRLAGREHRAPAVPGGLDQEVLRFAGVARGRTSLVLYYRRSWDPPGGGEQVYRVEVEVAGPYTGPAVRAPAVALAPAIPALAGGTVPTSYNACDSGTDPYARCTPVKDQGSCGSCWAFATVGVFENVLHLADPSQTPDLSEQYLVSCNSEGMSCDGGYVAFQYYIDRWRAPPETAAGAVYEADFPYTAVNTACGSTAHPHHEKAASWGWAVGDGATPAQRVARIQQAILERGPVFTDVCADTAFQSWKPADGPFAGSGCTKINHGVVLVGWGQEGGTGYWIMRNSWGPRWGDRGYMRIAWGANAIASDAAYAVYAGGGANQRPSASAGPAQTVDEGSPVALDGSASADADGSIQGWAWVQTAGPAVTLSGAATALPTFTAPPVSSSTELGFRLTVRDDRGAESSAGTTVTVQHVASKAKLGPGGVSAGCGTGGSAGGAWAVILLAMVVWRRRARI